MEKETKKICCICGKEIEGYGNDPWGAAWKDENGNVIQPTYNKDEKCCNECNSRYVIPGRLYLLKQKRMSEVK